MIVLNHFPSSLRQVPQPTIIPGAEDSRFPVYLVYDTTAIGVSRMKTITIASDALLSHAYNNYHIPETAPFTNKNISSCNEHVATIITTQACQFNLVERYGKKSHPVIFILQGSRIVMMGEVWKLVAVKYRESGAALFYRSERMSMPVVLRIMKENPGYPTLDGEYYSR
jgi:hypothetical protein